MFYGTSISTCILIFKKCRRLEDKDHILFINASDKFETDKKQNILSNEHIGEILETYINKKEKNGYSTLISLDKIKNNDYSLNISNYVSETIIEESISLDKLLENIETKKQRIKDIDKELDVFLKELNIIK